MTITLTHYLVVSTILFSLGLLGVLIRRNFIIVLMAIEMMLNAANLNLVAFSHYLNSFTGQMVALHDRHCPGEAAVGWPSSW
jgi:NADH-quinone oxidoreductase subunit K